MKVVGFIELQLSPSVSTTRMRLSTIHENAVTSKPQIVAICAIAILFVSKQCNQCLILSLARSLRVTADDLDLVCMKFRTCVCLELDILDQESPDIIAKPVSLEVAFERESRFDLLC